jgi:hypothetical protein
MTAIIAQYIGFSTLKNKAKLAKIIDKGIKYERQHNENEMEEVLRKKM